MNQKILCVDDEPNILLGYQRALRKSYDITVAESGAAAMGLLESAESFAVIVSDMRMPGMDGVQFLARAREISPESVRIMLTGNVDQQTAIDAVNQGHIFRFLNKPCSAEDLSNALQSALEQHRLIMAEKELLEGTLNQSLQVMVDLLSMVNPLAFSRTIRVKRLARAMALRLGVPNLWEVETAAMLSQIGGITLPKKILTKVNNGKPLSRAEQAQYDNHPQVAQKLIARVPRLQNAAAIIAHQNDLFTTPPPSLNETSDPDLVRCCAQIIKIAHDFDRLIYSGRTAHEAWREMAGRDGWYIPAILDALKQLLGQEVTEEVEKKLQVTQLRPGMTLAQSLRKKTGEDVLTSGTELTAPLLLQLQNLFEDDAIEPTLAVRVPTHLLPKVQATTV